MSYAKHIIFIFSLLLGVVSVVQAVVVKNPAFEENQYYLFEFHDTQAEAQQACIDQLASWGYGSSYCTLLNRINLPGLEQYAGYGSAYFRDKNLGSSNPVSYSVAFFFNVGCPAPYNPACHRCPSGELLNENDFVCEAQCPASETWEVGIGCQSKPTEQSCKTTTSDPIDITKGRKYRDEFVIGAGRRYPFNLHYFYNNQGNKEQLKTAGTIAARGEPLVLVHSSAPIATAEYVSSYTNIGALNDEVLHNPDQFYGGMDQYWRHSYDEVLQRMVFVLLFTVVREKPYILMV